MLLAVAGAEFLRPALLPELRAVCARPFVCFEWVATVVGCGARSELLGLVDGGATDGADDPWHDAASEEPIEANDGDALEPVCAFDGGAFDCGDGSCSQTLEFCWEVVGGPQPGVDNLACSPLPAGCCACSCAAYSKACFCDDDAGGVHVTCPVP